MKKISVLIAMVLILGLFAVSMTAAIDIGDERSYVVDAAGVLTARQRDELEKRARRMTDEFMCDVRIVILDSIGELMPMHASNALFIDYGFGYGSDRSCVLFLLSVEGRDFDLAVWGFGETAITEHGKDVILDKHVLPLLKTDDFYEAFSAFLDITDEFLYLAEYGTPFDTYTDPGYISKAAITNFIARLGIVIVLPMLIAAHVCTYWEKKMKTALIARTAHSYIPTNGFRLSGQQDSFLYRTVSRVKIVRTSSGGSSRSRRSGSGGSHRSGKF